MSRGRKDAVVVPIYMEVSPEARRVTNQFMSNLAGSASTGRTFTPIGVPPGISSLQRQYGTGTPFSATAGAGQVTSPFRGYAQAARRNAFSQLQEQVDLADMVRLERAAAVSSGGFFEPGDRLFPTRGGRRRGPPISAPASGKGGMSFSNAVMGFGVPAAIGLGGMPMLGPALNIGFASMSGGPAGAGIAAGSFAAGGGTRAVIGVTNALRKFQDELVKVAEGMLFVTDNFRVQQADSTAFKVFQGGVASFVKERNLEKWNDMLKESISTITDFNMNFANLRSIFGEIGISTAAIASKTVGGPGPASMLGATAIGHMFGLGGVGAYASGEAVLRTAQQRREMVPALNEMLENLKRDKFQPAFMGPEQYFKRQQLRLTGGKKDEEQRALMIKRLEELIEEIKGAKRESDDRTGGEMRGYLGRLLLRHMGVPIPLR